MKLGSCELFGMWMRTRAGQLGRYMEINETIDKGKWFNDWQSL